MRLSRFTRRGFAGLALSALLAFAGGLTALSAPAEAADKQVRVGYQKYGTFLLLKARGALEQKLEPLGYQVSWVEFPGGPQLLEALNVGALDFGVVGEAPPIFAQAAGAPLVYVAHEPPAPKSEAILVPKTSALSSVAELKGKKVAFNKGSNVHYLVVKALEAAGLSYADIQPVFLAPADARAAFEGGNVDAWAIWDPFLAAAEIALEARVLADGEGIVANHQFYVGERGFVERNPEVVTHLLASISEIDAWASGNVEAAAKELAPAVGVPQPVLALALSRQAWDARAVSPEIIAEQQKIADVFFGLGLLPKALDVSEAAPPAAATAAGSN